MADSDTKGNILVVDDEAQITRVLKTTLSSQGYGVRTAADGELALNEMKTWAPDLVITDLRMPNMDGLQLCRRIRAYSRIPIIVLSVKGEETIKVEALDAGADDYVTKPFSVNELLARVRASLRRASEPESTEATVLDVGDFHIDIPGRRVNVRNHVPIPLKSSMVRAQLKAAPKLKAAIRCWEKAQISKVDRVSDCRSPLSALHRAWLPPN